MLLAAEFQNGLRRDHLGNDTPNCIRAIGYATPPCVSEELADAMKKDKIGITVINEFDIIPCSSRANLAALAQEVTAFIEKATVEFEKDSNDILEWAKTCGKSGALRHSSIRADTVITDHDDLIVPKVTQESTTDINPNTTTSYSSAAPAAPASDAATDPVNSVNKQGPTSVITSAATVSGPTSVGCITSAVNTAVDSSTATKSVIPTLVPPGVLIYLYKHLGQSKASIIDHRHSAFRKIQIIADQVVEAHTLTEYYHNLRSIRSSYSEPRRYPARCISDYKTLESQGDLSICGICSCTVTWPFKTRHSDAAKATDMRLCTVCGIVCCVMCSPMHDEIPGEGVGNVNILPDWSISVPSRGIFKPSRVCVHCYLDSYNLI